MNHSRMEVRTFDALAAKVERVRAGIVAIDGCPLAGKSTVCVQICERLGIVGLELDDYLVPDRGEYVNALRTNEVLRALQEAHSRTSLVLLDGVCMRAILEVLDITADLLVYVQPISHSGVLGNLEMLDAENGKFPDPTTAYFFNELDREVFAYHSAYQPFSRADLVYYRIDE
ncbi:nucleoside/nucleotide kinase family protein [Burkholderia cenocepacia]|uniref:hypothetical protein n=1 Tax=Burkholderia cenocepacia TaxID=95486 RepID=UPI002ABD58A5|nr:hypothetical protein [Burkholderia cenocepacia]